MRTAKKKSMETTISPEEMIKREMDTEKTTCIKNLVADNTKLMKHNGCLLLYNKALKTQMRHTYIFIGVLIVLYIIILGVFL